MKKSVFIFMSVPVLVVLLFLISSSCANAQETTKKPSVFTDDVNRIVTTSCTPCHTSKGGLMSRSKFNIDEWQNYSPEKQKEKAAKIYSEISKGSMPPKTARQKRPDLIPTTEQAETIKKWSESFVTVPK